MRRVINWLLICVLLLSVSTTVYADAPRKGVEETFPTEEEMGYTIPEEKLIYKKYPMSHYKWDTAQELLRMQGITPKIGDVGEITSTTMVGFFQDINLGLTRFIIFMFQSGFASKGDFLLDAIGKIDKEVQPLKKYAYENLLWFVSSVLSIIMIIKYAQGRTGEAIKTMLMALLTLAIMYGVIDNLESVISTSVDIVDYFVLTLLGIMNFMPVLGSGAATLIGDRIVEISNTIFTLNVQQPWLYGEFMSLDSPNVTKDELDQVKEVDALERVQIKDGQAWAEVLLSYPPGSEERNELIKILADNEIVHDKDFTQTYLWSGAGDRWLLFSIALIANILDSILFGGTGIIQFGSKILIIVLATLMPILAIFGFFGEAGHRGLMKMLGIFFYAFALKVACALFIGLPMLINHFINTSMMKYTLALSLHICVSLFGVVLLPTLFTHITPALIRGSVKMFQAVQNPKRYIRRETNKALYGNRKSGSIESMRRSRAKNQKSNLSRNRQRQELNTTRPASTKENATSKQSTGTKSTRKAATTPNLSQKQTPTLNTPSRPRRNVDRTARPRRHVPVRGRMPRSRRKGRRK